MVVRDEGSGIPLDALDAIWGANVQAEGAREGNGVGLSVVKAMIEEMGGRVQAANHPAGGAMFTLWLPLSSPAPQTEPAFKEPPQKTEEADHC